MVSPLGGKLTLCVGSKMKMISTSGQKNRRHDISCETLSYALSRSAAHKDITASTHTLHHVRHE